MKGNAMHFKLLHPRNYVGAPDLLGRDVVVEIEKVEHKHELVRQGGAKDIMPVIHLKGKKKKWVLNKTNAQTIADLHGVETDNWPGKRVTLYSDKTRGSKGEIVDCIRVRPTIPGDVESSPPDPDEATEAPPADTMNADDIDAAMGAAQTT